MDKNKIVEIKNLVRDAHLKSAIKELMELLSGSNLEREAILLKQRFNHLDKDTAWLEYKSVQEERTRIGMSVLQLLASLDDFDFNIDNLTKNETLLAVLKSKLLPFYEPIYTWHQ
jgi:hypothetical protein